MSESPPSTTIDPPVTPPDVDVPAIEMPAPSADWATCGRIVHVYSTAWEGPRPGIVIANMIVADGPKTGAQELTVNVMLDGTRDAKVLDVFRKRAKGNTLENVPLYDQLSHEQRAAVLAENKRRGAEYLCEWPPRPSGPAQPRQADGVREALTTLLSDPAGASIDPGLAQACIDKLT